MNRISAPMMIIVGAGSIAFAVLGLWAGGDTLQSWALASRWTARWAALIFLCVFLTSMVHRLAPQPATQWAMRNRRGTGLSFALAHGIHAIVFTLAILQGTSVAKATLVGGSVIYGVLAALVVTSTNAAQRRMGRWWRRLHSFGVWLLWLNFTIAFANGLSMSDPDRQLASMIATSVFVSAAALKLISIWVRRPVRVPA